MAAARRRPGARINLRPRAEGRTRAASATPRVALSASDEGQDLVAVPLHLRRGVGFEVEAEQRLGVAGADVEVPVVVVHRDPVEPLDARVLVALLDALQGSRRVADLGV